MVALLSFADGEPFARGATYYAYRPATENESSPRLVIQVEIEGIGAAAIVDTGAPYVVCTPIIARRLGLTPANALESVRLLIRGIYWRGHLYLLNVRFLAIEGENLDVTATVFAPDPSQEESWGDLPSFIGLNGCLGRMRFAVDPADDSFYFGPMP